MVSTMIIPPTDPTESARAEAARNYLDVRYTPERRPYTSYPGELCRHLHERFIAGRNFRTLLDLGCGRGDFLDAFRDCGLETVGLDSSKFSNGNLKSKVIHADIEGKAWPIESGSLDVVFSKSVIEHIRNVDVLLSETRRVLKPGGIAIIMTPDWATNFRHFYDDYTHVSPFTMMGLSDAVRAHGLKIEVAEHFRQLPFVWKRPWMHAICGLLALLPDSLKRYKTVKFSKEWMLLVVARKA
jgi:SAM-dependent methyltransferase